jgi:hypothetical protein
MFEAEYRAVLKALGANQTPTQPRIQADSASVYDVASMLEFGTSAVHKVAPPRLQPPPRWSAQLRLTDFDMPSVWRQPAPTPENEQRGSSIR